MCARSLMGGPASRGKKPQDRHGREAGCGKRTCRRLVSRPAWCSHGPMAAADADAPITRKENEDSRPDSSTLLKGNRSRIALGSAILPAVRKESTQFPRERVVRVRDALGGSGEYVSSPRRRMGHGPVPDESTSEPCGWQVVIYAQRSVLTGLAGGIVALAPPRYTASWRVFLADRRIPSSRADGLRASMTRPGSPTSPQGGMPAFQIAHVFKSAS